ncbi:MAG: clostripain-related cysteine peptidase [Elusimicrobia bacterium]|nr:clostripain-related cysteine peptidase [Elusimicrobiota bacterium]
MKTHILRTLVLIFTLVLYAGAQEASLNNFYEKLNDAKAVTLTSAASPATIAVPAPAAAAEIKAPDEMAEWLVMVFINARNNLWPAGIMDINEMEMIGSTAKVAVTAELGILQDKGNSTRFFIQKDNGDSKMTSPGIEVKNSDMGSWKHFVDFAKWSIKRYPAKRYMVILWNHGSGRIDIGGADNSGAELGIAYDDLTRNFIRNSQIAKALKEISQYAGKKVDIYASDACLMQMLSVAYEIKDYAEYLVQSEEIIPGYGFPYDAILQRLNDSPSSSAASTASMLVDEYHNYYSSTEPYWYKKDRSPDYKQGTTISAISSRRLYTLNFFLNKWIREIVKVDRVAILKAIDKTFSLGYGNDGHDTSHNVRSKDLYDFAEQVNKIADKNSPLYAAGAALQKYMVNRLIVANKTTGPNTDYNRAKGLAVYFPKMIYDASYDEMLISRDSLWDDFIKWTLDRDSLWDDFINMLDED